MKPSKTIIIPIGIFLASLLVIGGRAWYASSRQSEPSTTAPLVQDTETPETTPSVAATDSSSGLPAVRLGSTESRRGQAGTIIPPTKTDCTDDLDTTCWNTYRNEAYGFELKLASIFKIDYQQTSTFQVYNHDGYYFSIFEVEGLNAKGSLLYSEVKDIFGYESISIFEDVVFNGQKAKVIRGLGSGAYPEGDVVIYFFPKTNGQEKNLAFKLGSIMGGSLDQDVVDKFKKSLELLIFE